MSKNALILPFYLKASQITLGILAGGYLLYVGQDIVLPLVLAIIIAILLNPMVNNLSRRGLSTGLSIIITLVMFIVLLAGGGFFIVYQAVSFSDAFPEMFGNLTLLWQQVVSWICEVLSVNEEVFHEWLSNIWLQARSSTTALLGGMLGDVSSFIAASCLLPIYVFMLLYYKSLLHAFILRLFPNGIAEDVIRQTKLLIQGYLRGLMLESAVVGMLQSLVLVIIGIPYALLFGVIGGMVNLIPYVGSIIAMALPILLSLATGQPLKATWVGAAYMVIQFLDNYFLVPKIVDPKVQINALVSIIAVLIGGAIWGVSGMFLSIPVTAVLKVIFDKVQSLQPLGFLLGDTSVNSSQTTSSIVSNPK